MKDRFFDKIDWAAFWTATLVTFAEKPAAEGPERIPWGMRDAEMGTGRSKLARVLKPYRRAKGKEIDCKRDERSRPECRPVDLVEKSVFHLTKKMVRESDHLVGILPEPAVAAELADGRLLRLPVRLPEFTFDVHFNPIPEFAGKTVCQLLKSAIESK